MMPGYGVGDACWHSLREDIVRQRDERVSSLMTARLSEDITAAVWRTDWWAYGAALLREADKG
jgi:hypothetical protein